MKRKSVLRHFKLFILVSLGIILTQDYFPLINPSLAQNPKTFEDIQGHWAQNCIEELAQIR
jgi:hypothetical protein